MFQDILTKYSQIKTEEDRQEREMSQDNPLKGICTDFPDEVYTAGNLTIHLIELSLLVKDKEKLIKEFARISLAIQEIQKERYNSLKAQLDSAEFEKQMTFLNNEIKRVGPNNVKINSEMMQTVKNIYSILGRIYDDLKNIHMFNDENNKVQFANPRVYSNLIAQVVYTTQTTIPVDVNIFNSTIDLLNKIMNLYKDYIKILKIVSDVNTRIHMIQNDCQLPMLMNKLLGLDESIYNTLQYCIKTLSLAFKGVKTII